MGNSIQGRSFISLLAISVVNQAIGLGLQIVVAKQFGASVNLDAYIAGLAIPQYLVLIINAGINASLLPAYYEKREGERDTFLRDLTATLFAGSLLVSLAGFVFAPTLFRMFFSELPAPTIAIGVTICRYGFLSLITNVLINVLTSIHFIRGKFSYQAIVPALGQVANLLVVWVLADFGINALLIAFLSSQVLQVGLLLPVLRQPGGYATRLAAFSPPVGAFLAVTLPMTCSTIFIKATGLWDRYLAGMAANKVAGTISHVDYAGKITTALAALSISALPTLIFPSISAAVARKDHAEFIKIVNEGLFLSVFITVPIVCIGYFISLDVVQLLLQRGRFTASDSVEVAAILQVYLFSVVVRGMGGVTGNALYALKLTTWVSVLGSIEALLYIGYSYFLTRQLGVVAIPLAFIIYFSISIVWALSLIRHKADAPIRLLSNHRDYVKVAVVAVATALVAYLSDRVTGHGLVAIVVTTCVGGVVYLTLCHLAGIELAMKVVLQLKKPFKRAAPGPVSSPIHESFHRSAGHRLYAYLQPG